MWQEQLISIVEGNSLDPDHIADLLVTYEAETGDASLRGCGEALVFMGALRHWPASGSRAGSWTRSKSMSGFGSGAGAGSKSKSGAGAGSKSKSWSRSWSWSLSGCRPWSLSGYRSRSKSASRSGSK